MKNNFIITLTYLLIVTLSSCSHWNWIYKNEALVREKICRPDTTHETIVSDTLYPLSEINQSLLTQLNDAETKVISLNNELNKIETSANSKDSTITQLKNTIQALKKTINDIRVLATNQKVRVITKVKPYPIYHDSQATMLDLLNTREKLSKYTTATWSLSFACAILLIILALCIYIIIRKK